MKTIRTIIFWVLSCTWGIILTTFGAIVALGCLLTGHKPHIFASRYVYFIFENATGWGFEGGPFFFLSRDAHYTSLMQHEAGHGLQNVVFGPLAPFLINIPSMIRFHYRNWVSKKHPEKPLPDYYSIWFEAQASEWGMKHYPNGELR